MTLHEAVTSVKGIFRQRRQAHREEGQLATAFREAMRIMDAQKADGVPFADRICGLDAALKSVWPFTREWKYLCQTCDDIGLELLDCDGKGRCGRTKLHLPHSYGVPCWCQAGARYRVKPKPDPANFTDAGKSKQPTRVGR